MILLYQTCFPPPEDTARFKKPALLKYRTMNGVAVNVIAILNGAKNLCTAYATTNVPAFDPAAFRIVPSLILRYFSIATKSTPLK